MRRAMTAIPPTTPPAIAPAGGDGAATTGAMASNGVWPADIDVDVRVEAADDGVGVEVAAAEVMAGLGEN